MNRSIGLACGFAIVLSACDADIVPPTLDESFFYLILEPGGIWDGLGTFNHYAVTATIARADDVRCRAVQRFSLVSVPDGTPFATRIDGACETIFGNPSIPVDRCCTIPGTAPPDSLGALDLRHGGSYDVEIATEGVVIRGSLAIPRGFAVQIADDGGIRRLIWPSVIGAAGYEINLGLGEVVRQEDTTIVLESDFAGSVRVLALEPNLWAYLVDDNVRRSGIDVGAGVFGGISAAARVEVLQPQLDITPK